MRKKRIAESEAKAEVPETYIIHIYNLYIYSGFMEGLQKNMYVSIDV